MKGSKKDNGSRWGSKASKALRGLKIGGDGNGTGHRNHNHAHTNTNGITNTNTNTNQEASQDLPWGGMGTKIDEHKQLNTSNEKTLDDKNYTESSNLITPKNNKGGANGNEAAPHDKKNSKKLDEYGFIVNLDDKGDIRDSDSVDIPGGAYTPSADTPKRNHRHVKPRVKKQLVKLHRRREKKWLGMLKNWDAIKASKPKRIKLRERIRKGIPNSVRGEAWTRIAGVKEKVETSQKGVYGKFVEATCEGKDAIDSGLETFEPNQEFSVDNSVMRETIERDLQRTFPRHNMFYDQESDSSDDEYSDGSYDKLSSFDSGGSKDSEEHAYNCIGTTSIETDSGQEVEVLADIEAETNADISCFGDGADDNCLSKVAGNCPPSIFTETKEVAFEPIQQPEPKTRKKKQKRVVDICSADGGQAKLRRVLRAYSYYDQEVGYCQGMNFIAGMFITFVDEEEAFWLLVSVMCEAPCRMRGLFSEGMSQAHQVLHVADRLIKQFHPKLFRHFEREQIHITMFATQWLLTVYTSSFPFDVVTRVWDAFLSEGWKVAYRVMLALLEKVQPLLMKMKFEEILNYFKEMPFQIDVNEILELAFKLPLKKKHITKYAREWEREQNRPKKGR